MCPSPNEEKFSEKINALFLSLEPHLLSVERNTRTYNAVTNTRIDREINLPDGEETSYKEGIFDLGPEELKKKKIVKQRKRTIL